MARKITDSRGDGAETALIILEHFYRTRLEDLQNLHRHVAHQATTRKRLELQINNVRRQVEKAEADEERVLAADRPDIAATLRERAVSNREMLDRWEKQHDAIFRAEMDSSRADELLKRMIDELRFSIEAFKGNISAGSSPRVIGSGQGVQTDMPSELAARLAMMDDLLPAGIRRTSSYAATGGTP